MNRPLDFIVIFKGSKALKYHIKRVVLKIRCHRIYMSSPFHDPQAFSQLLSITLLEGECFMI